MNDRTAPRTATEKIVARHAPGWTAAEPPRGGDFVSIRPRHVMTHDNTSAVIPKFQSLAGPDAAIFDPTQPVIAIDHDIQNHTPENLGKYAAIRRFAESHNLRYYPPGRGIAHQVMIEEGFVRPGDLIVGSDSHSTMYGALAALGTPVVRTDAAAIWATGETWWAIPPRVRVTLTGRLSAGSTGKDIILTLCRIFHQGEALNAALEFAGDGVASLSIDDRMTIANMSTEWGALAAWFPFDETLRDWLLARPAAGAAAGWAEIDRLWNSRDSFSPDPDAPYDRELTLDLTTVTPHVTGPNNVWRSRAAAEIETEQIRINKAYLMSCVNARLSDLEAAAAVFGDTRRVAPGVEFYIAAASATIEEQARARGIWQRLINAGAIALPSGCGACIGLGRGTLRPGEVGISATNRNYEGRMGARDADCYLASPAVVAESAIRGVIAAPRHANTPPSHLAPRGTALSRTTTAPLTAAPRPIIDGFPAVIRGRSIILTRDNIDTDGIYGKDVTYRDDITRAEQGRYALLNYDPAFQTTALPGDILIAGRNFGTGSSREQAATALQSRGIAAIIAASMSQTFQRNAFNNGVLALECPSLADVLTARAADTPDTRTLTGPDLTIDFAAGIIRALEREFRFTPLSEVAQRLIVAGGFENLIRDQIAAKHGVLA